jgi:hypothetical protein
MRDTRDESANSAPQPITAESIVKTIIGWEPMSVRENLHKLMFAFFMYHDDNNIDTKEAVYVSFSILSEALWNMETLRLRIEQDKKENTRTKPGNNLNHKNHETH